MAAQTWPGGEFHKTEGLGSRGVNHFPDVNAKTVAHHGHFVDQADINHAEGVFEQLRHLGNFGGGDGDNGLQRAAVPGSRNFRTGIGNTADHLGGVNGRPVFPTRIHSFGRKCQEEVFTNDQIGIISQLWQQNFARGARIGGRFEYHDHARVHIFGKLRSHGENKREIRVTGFA